MAKKKIEIDMTSGPLLIKIITFALPLMLTSILQLLYNAADIVVVGKFAGDASLAAVGATSALTGLIVNLFMGMATGTGVIIAQAIGANNNERLHKTVHTAMLLSIILGFIVGGIGFTVSKHLLLLMSTPEDVLPKATVYVQIYFLGLPGLMVYNFGAAILRSAGDTKRPLLILTLSGIANVILNLILVISFKMDVAGVATATIISQYISAVWVVVFLIRDNAPYRLYLSKLRIYGKNLLQILRFGVPMGIQSSFFALSNVLIQSSVNTFDSIVIAGNTAAANIEGFIFVANDSSAQAAMTFAGQNYGAKKYKRIKKIMLECSLLCLIIGTLMGAAVLLLKEPLLSFYTDSAAVIEAGVIRINIICMFYSLCGIMGVIGNTVRGMGKSLIPMLITMIFVCVMRVVWLYTAFAAVRTIETIYWSYPVSWGLAIIAQLIYFIAVYKRKIKSDTAEETNK